MERSLLLATNARLFIAGVLRLGDALIVFLAGLLAYWIRHGHINLPDDYLVALVLATVLTANFHHFARLYEFPLMRSLAQQFGPLTISWVLVILVLIALGYFTKTSDAFSRIWMGLWLGMNLIGFLLLRLWSTVQIQAWYKNGKLKTNIAVYGAGEEGAAFAAHLLGIPDNQTKLIGIFDDRKTRISAAFDRELLQGDMEDLLIQVRDNRIDKIIVALPLMAGDRLSEILATLNAAPVEVHLCPNATALPFPVRGYSQISGMPVIDVFEPPLSGWNLVVKTIEDYVLASLLLIAFLPVMGVIALLVRLSSPGPVLFKQLRYGFNNNEFSVYKFRTMKAEAASDERVPQARRDDPRVTPIGSFLRRTSLDELPQLFNVLKGEMSIVGPRPHAVAHNKHYAKIINEYMGRHKVRPGITGWAQINGLRGETDTPDKMRKRVQFDLYYIDHWSLSLDLRIIFLTPFVVFIRPDAY